MNRILSLLFRGLALAAPAALLVFAQPASAQSAAATSANYPYKASRPVPGRYIVVLKNDVTDPAERQQPGPDGQHAQQERGEQSTAQVRPLRMVKGEVRRCRVSPPAGGHKPPPH